MSRMLQCGQTLRTFLRAMPVIVVDGIDQDYPSFCADGLKHFNDQHGTQSLQACADTLTGYD